MSGNVQQGLGRNAPRVQAIATQKLFFRQNNFGTQSCCTYSRNKSRWPATNDQKMAKTGAACSLDWPGEFQPVASFVMAHGVSNSSLKPR
jgi:hypothetical protein